MDGFFYVKIRPPEYLKAEIIMPELPEVETTCRGIRPRLLEQTIEAIVIRQPRLRWPIPEEIQQAVGMSVETVQRRGKYILIGLSAGTIIIHLGMSGSLRLVGSELAPGKHDHVDIRLNKQLLLRLNDPRRFGAVLWWQDPIEAHPLLVNLGPEPLEDDFDEDYLWRLSRGRKQAVKTFIMNGHIVVGVGNIYASEALFRAGILPQRQAGRISRQRYQHLSQTIRQVLQEAIAQGGTTLQDFTNSDGQPGYFAQELLVYGRENQSCVSCTAAIKMKVITQRASFYCSRCQS